MKPAELLTIVNIDVENGKDAGQSSWIVRVISLREQLMLTGERLKVTRYES